MSLIVDKLSRLVDNPPESHDETGIGMTTWILLFVIAMGNGGVGFQVEGFESHAECERAGRTAYASFDRTLRYLQFVCIERKASR